jgi:hypothetical protein
VTDRIFLLSPASCAGDRARMVMRAEAAFPLALRLRGPRGAPLGEVFAFLSGLYFRGKLTYAARFARPPAELPGAFVITPNAGLVETHRPVTVGDLRRFARVDIDARNPRYRRPFLRDAARVAREHPGVEVVLLGSVASDKYVAVLLEVFGERLLFPPDFVGRGDMSRGGLLLRAAREGRELDYGPVAGAVRHGPRPPKLPRLPRLPARLAP